MQPLVPFDMRRLHPRGPASRGVSVDAAGAMLGPDCVLVGRTASGFQGLPAVEAGLVQAAVLDPGLPSDWLFDHCRRIATALRQGEVALAQIYGLYIPAGELDDAALRRLATLVPLVKAGFDPDEPRIPKGEPGAGQWTYEEGYAKPREHDDPDGSTGGGTGLEPPSDTGGDEPPQIPAERPATAQERNSFVRRAAVWLAQASERQLRLYLLMLEMATWPVEYLPEIPHTAIRRRPLKSFRMLPIIPRNEAITTTTSSSANRGLGTRTATPAGSATGSIAGKISSASRNGGTSTSAPGIRGVTMLMGG